MHPGTPQEPLQTPGALTPARLRQAKELMLRSSLSIIEIASVCNLTRSHRAFSRLVGQPPKAWRQAQAIS
ncbi:helix-turn-helix transcriptional regulator [Pseudomonas monteilii]|uniref:helix-turn-helix transcriptional regulator n=1 Tax=Pseudomonas TaxID=286 RepID=UPI0018E67249|nr:MULTISPECIES: helix-turn-helix transcriptional regulator [Pseudomonas]MBI6918023.1 helix-turn-helix transcriptional regulator [Pseudomonas monteilii]MCE0936676.1 hypothetical protein [Pseudomonas kurunegalensis]